MSPFFRAIALTAMFSSIAVSAPASPERLTDDTTVVEIKANGDVVLTGRKPISDAAEIKKILVSERERQERAAISRRVTPSPSIRIRPAIDSPFPD